MGYPTRVQLIKRKASEQWYINFPSAVARAMEFKRSELVEWIIEDKSQLVLKRTEVPPLRLKKKPPAGSSTVSRSSGSRAKPPSARTGSRGGQKGSP
ncbi:MAG: hypothetical protein AABZ40_00705 [Thermodesulfobacteriota bacterium]